MTMQSEHHAHGWTDSLAVQLTLTTIAIIAVIAIAWFTVF